MLEDPTDRYTIITFMSAVFVVSPLVSTTCAQGSVRGWTSGHNIWLSVMGVKVVYILFYAVF